MMMAPWAKVGRPILLGVMVVGIALGGVTSPVLAADAGRFLVIRRDHTVQSVSLVQISERSIVWA